MRYVYAITSSLLLGGAVASLAMQPPAAAQTAQNEPGTIAASAPRAGAPMSFADMVARLQPAVVNVSTTQHVKVDANPFAGTPFGQLFGGGGGQPITREAQSLGSGFIISPDGYVVTNNHVISAGARGATVDEITVILSDRREFKARVIGKDQASDLALLKIDANGLPFVRWGDSTRSRVGDWVVAIGNPFGLGGTVTAGIISALHRVTGATGSNGAYDRFIQTDAAINRGNSGGPMFDMAGNVIGINSQILTPSEGSVGIGFAIPAEIAKPIIDTFMHGGKVVRGYLGVGIQPVSDDIASAMGLPKNRGEIISRLEPGQAAEKAGVKQGDVVVSVNGQEVTPDNTLSYMVGNLKPGSQVRLGILRDNKPVTLTATVGTRPPEDQLAAEDFNSDDDNDGVPDQEEAGPTAPSNAIGITVTPLTPAIARSIGVDPSTVHGVVITAVDPSSDAANKGLQRGDVISSVNRMPVTTTAAFATAIRQARAAGRADVLLFLTRPRGGSGFFGVKLKTAR